MQERRTNVLIDPPVQLRLAGLVVLSGLTTFMLGVAFAWLNWRLLMFRTAGDSVSMEAISEVFWFYGLLSVAAFVLIVMILTFLTLIVTNRVVGPLYRLRKELTRMLEEKDVEMISVRDRDYIEDFVRVLNRFLLEVQRSDRTLEVESNRTRADSIDEARDLLEE